jgi:hypothetical protein
VFLLGYSIFNIRTPSVDYSYEKHITSTGDGQILNGIAHDVCIREMTVFEKCLSIELEVAV